MTDNRAPTRPRATKLDWVLAALILLIPLGVIVRASRPNTRPELIPQLAGCYAGVPPYQNLKLRLNASGSLDANKQTTDIRIERDKIGMTIVPDRLVTFDEDIGGGRINVSSHSPLFLRIAPDFMGFTIPNESGPSLGVRRAAC